MSDDDVSSLFANSLSSLLHGSEHRFASYGTFAIGETADGNILRHTVAHALNGIQNADGSIIVHGKESIWHLILLHQLWRYHFGISPVVADAEKAIVGLKTSFQQSILVSIISIFRYLHAHRRTIERYLSATGIDEMVYCRESSHIVVYHHTACINARRYAVVEHQWYAVVQEFWKWSKRRVSLACDTITPLTLWS